MIRFIDLGRQIGDDDASWPRQFCFYDTVIDCFLEFAGEQVWDSWEDLASDISRAFTNVEGCLVNDASVADQDIRKIHDAVLLRLRSLCPQWVFQKEEALQRRSEL